MTQLRDSRQLRLLLILLVLAGSSAPTALAQNSSSKKATTVVLTELNAPAASTEAQRVAAALTTRIGLIIRLAGNITVDRADFLTPAFDLQTVSGYYRKVAASAAVFGQVTTASDGGYTITVDIWSPTAARPRVVSEHLAHSPSGGGGTDRLSLEVASTVVGRKLSVGTLELHDTRWLKSFGVYADGQLLGRNGTRFPVLSGERRIIVAKPGPLGDQPVQVFQVTIRPNQITTVTLKAPAEATAKPEPAPKKSSAVTKTRQSAAPAPKSAVQTHGSLKVDSTPEGATVFLNQRVLGKTPLSLFGVPTGKYTLRLKRTFFLPTSQVVDITNGKTAAVTAKLEVNRSDPELAAHLVSPGKASIDSLIWTAVQASLVVAAVPFGPGASQYQAISNPLSYGQVMNLPGMASYYSDVYLLRIGHQYAHGGVGATVLDVGGLVFGALSLGGALALNLWNPVASGNQSQTNLYNLLQSAIPFSLITATTLSVLYDLVFAPGAAARYNDELIAHVAKTGELPKPKEWRNHPFIVEAGGGALARIGYRFRLIPNYLSLSATVGVAGLSYHPFVPAASVEARLAVMPFGAKTGSLRPVVFASTGGAATLAQWSATFGAGIGADMLFRNFTIMTRSEYRYGVRNQTSDGEFTVGVRF